MILFHGSNIIIEEIDLSKGHPYKDFGRGFYLTDNEKHAQNMAQRRILRLGGEPQVTKFVFDYSGALENIKVKVFEKPTEEWAKFVMMNRNENIFHPAHDFDIVIGPIADDSVALSFRLFNDGYISAEELAKRLEYKELSVQYFFHTPKALSFLNRIG